jgi:hypothetical protein
MSFSGIGRKELNMNQLYEERLKRINDTMDLKEPDVVLCAPMHMSFPF